MTKETIQTSLLGQRVELEDSGKAGAIRNVYLDPEGDPKYSVEVGGRLKEMYPCRFRVVTGEELMGRMMFAHSQCVVDDMCDRVRRLIETARDGGNFRPSEAKLFLMAVIEKMPNE